MRAGGNCRVSNPPVKSIVALKWRQRPDKKEKAPHLSEGGAQTYGAEAQETERLTPLPRLGLTTALPLPPQRSMC